MMDVKKYLLIASVIILITSGCMEEKPDSKIGNYTADSINQTIKVLNESTILNENKTVDKKQEVKNIRFETMGKGKILRRLDDNLIIILNSTDLNRLDYIPFYSEEKHLFNLSIEYKEYLKTGEVGDQLRRIFKHNNISLSSNARISKASEKNWDINEETMHYMIEEVNKQLVISREDKASEKFFYTILLNIDSSKIDFDNYFVLIVIYSAPYGMEVKKLNHIENTLTLIVGAIEQPQYTTTIDIEFTPYQVIKIKKSDVVQGGNLTFIFADEKENELCSETIEIL